MDNRRDKDDDPSVSDWLEGGWTVEEANIEGLNNAPSNWAFELESDGGFDFRCIFAGRSVMMASDWSVTDDGDDLELTYDLQTNVWVVWCLVRCNLHS